jgi:FMN phosphatase YigB (HAD superfamily)
MNLGAGDVIMVGEGPYSDIGGARNAGIQAVQVSTGKYRWPGSSGAPNPDIIPDAITGSIADLPALLGIAQP